MLIFMMDKILRKINFNFIDVTFSPTLKMFFLTLSKMNIKLSDDIEFMKKNIFISFYNENSLLYI